LQTELDRFFKVRFALSPSFATVTKSAFSQARKKVDAQVFKDLNQAVLSYSQVSALRPRSWKGKRVVAIDGSLLNLPYSDEIRSYFGGAKNQFEEIVSARCSFAYDICNELVLDAVVDKRRSCEKELAVEHLAALNPSTDILVFDRGYPAHWLIGLLNNLGFKYCFRLSTAWREAHDAVNDNSNDIEWTIKWSSHRALDRLKELNIPKQIANLRLVNVTLSSGEREVLLTNVTDKAQFTYLDIKELYKMRWGVEEGFKQLKKTLYVEHFSGKSVLSVKQDFYAKVLLLNLASLIRNQAAKVSKRESKHKRKVNKTQALAKLKDFMVDLLYSKNIMGCIEKLMQLLERCTDIVREGRSFPRFETSSRRRVKTLNYRGI